MTAVLLALALTLDPVAEARARAPKIERPTVEVHDGITVTKIKGIYYAEDRLGGQWADTDLWLLVWHVWERNHRIAEGNAPPDST